MVSHRSQEDPQGVEKNICDTRVSPRDKGLMKLIGDTISHSEKDRQKSRVCEEEPPGGCHKEPHEEITQNIIFEKMKNPVEPDDVRIKFRDPGKGREEKDGSRIKEGRKTIEKQSLCG